MVASSLCQNFDATFVENFLMQGQSTMSFSEVMAGFRDFSTTAATFVPFGSFAYGDNSAKNTNAFVGSVGSGIGSIFGGATGALGGLMGNPVVLIGGAVVLLILIK